MYTYNTRSGGWICGIEYIYLTYNASAAPPVIMEKKINKPIIPGNKKSRDELPRFCYCKKFFLVVPTVTGLFYSFREKKVKKSVDMVTQVCYICIVSKETQTKKRKELETWEQKPKDKIPAKLLF